MQNSQNQIALEVLFWMYPRLHCEPPRRCVVSICLPKEGKPVKYCYAFESYGAVDPNPGYF